MPTYQDFRAWMFPGEAPVSNPLEISGDASVQSILREVSCQSGIKVDWLQRSVREVLEGLVGLQCLWFLHGASGEVESEQEPPGWVRGLINYIQYTIYSDPEEKRKGLNSADVVGRRRDVARSDGFDWAKGTVTFEKGYRERKPVKQTYKLGRFIDAFADNEGLDDHERKEMHNQLKWRRKYDIYEFFVSADPIDVLTMSHGRPWASCMKPGGLFEYGPLTDMAAGSAVVWFTPKGADTPSGRVILRPYLEDDGGVAIATGGALYGSGPDTSTDALNEMLSPWLQGIPINRVYICPRGERGLALTRAIYSDTDRLSDGCQQSLDQYKKAYAALSAADWPEPAWAQEEVRAAATKHKDVFDYREKHPEDRDDDLREANELLLEDVTEGVFEWLEAGFYYNDPSGFEILDWVFSSRDEVEGFVREYIDALIQEGYREEYGVFLEDGVYYDESIVEDGVRVLRAGLAQYLISGLERYGVIGVTYSWRQPPAVLRERLSESDLWALYSPKEILDFSESLFSYWLEMYMDEYGTPRDENSDQVVGAVLLCVPWFEEMAREGPFLETSPFMQGALVVQDGITVPTPADVDFLGKLFTDLRAIS